MRKRFGFRSAPGAGGVCIEGPPCRQGGRVAIASSDLMDPPSYELVQPYKGSLG